MYWINLSETERENKYLVVAVVDLRALFRERWGTTWRQWPTDKERELALRIIPHAANIDGYQIMNKGYERPRDLRTYCQKLNLQVADRLWLTDHHIRLLVEVLGLENSVEAPRTSTSPSNLPPPPYFYPSVDQPIKGGFIDLLTPGHPCALSLGAGYTPLRGKCPTY